MFYFKDTRPSVNLKVFGTVSAQFKHSRVLKNNRSRCLIHFLASSSHKISASQWHRSRIWSAPCGSAVMLQAVRIHLKEAHSLSRLRVARSSTAISKSAWHLAGTGQVSPKIMAPGPLTPSGSPASWSGEEGKPTSSCLVAPCLANQRPLLR